MKNLTVLILVSILLISSFGAVAQVTNNKSNNITDYSILIDVKIPELQFKNIIVKDKEFTSIYFNSDESTTKIGQAKLPVINKMIELPIGEDPLIEINDDDWSTISLSSMEINNKIAPVQPSVIKNLRKEDYEFTMDQKYYTTNKFFNTEKVRIVETGIIRGHRYALIQILPVQYNPVSNQLNAMKNCELKITVPNSNLKITQDRINKYTMPEFESILKNRVENYGQFFTSSIETTTATNSYLIIADDSFTAALDSFVNWKTQIGFDVTVTTLSEIPGGPTRDNIQDYIQDAYDNWNPPPGYVLLAGDTNQIPAFSGVSSNTATDLYYSTTDGTDYMPDILIGRFSGSQVSHITAMVDKTVGYESGYWSDDSFLEKGAFMAGTDNYHITEGTHDYVISNYFNPKDWTCDKLYEVTYGATTQDVRDSLNDGRVAAIYSGHGSTYSWADGPPFSQSDVSGLSNIKELSFVCSHACVTGNYEASECFGETWIRTPNKAAIIFWGSSANTLWDEDDVLEKLTLSYYFGNSPVAQMTNNGKIGLHGHYGGGGYSRYYMECYNILGDPSVVIGSSQSGGGGGGNEPDYTPPRVGISRPSYGSTVNGTIDVQGYAYGFEGPIKYVFLKINDSDWTKVDGKDEWTYSWNTQTVEDGEVLLQAVSIDSHGYQSGVDYVRVDVLNHPPEPEPKIPDLYCEGELSWDMVTPGEVVTGTISLQNIGDEESLLDWEISEYPEDWGRWTINPSEGNDLTPEEGIITIQINLEVPTDEEQIFNGQIKIENKEDSQDFDVIDIVLTTHREKSKDISDFSMILNTIKQKFPFLFNFII